MADKKRCLIAHCDQFGTWTSGICETCRRYLARAEKRPIAWRVARSETVAKWGARLSRTMENVRLPARKRA